MATVAVVIVLVLFGLNRGEFVDQGISLLLSAE